MWIEKKDKSLYNDSAVKGLRLYFDDNVTPDNRRECKEFCDWLRKTYWFPIRCKIYFCPQKKFKSLDDGHNYYGIFYDNEDDNIRKYPCIFIATKFETDDARYNCLFTIAHELTHYFQWYFYYDKELTKRSLEIWASKWARIILWEFENLKKLK